MTPVYGAALCRVMGLQGESAEPTAGTWFNLLLVTALKTEQLKPGFFRVFTLLSPHFKAQFHPLSLQDCSLKHS